MVAEVIRSNPDVVYAIPPSPLYFKKQTDKLPIVALTGDPVAAGFVQSLARPGGNMTGVSVDAVAGDGWADFFSGRSPAGCGSVPSMRRVRVSN